MTTILPLVGGPRLGAGLPVHVTSHMSGGRDLWSEPLAHAPEDPTAALWAALDEVLDPELPISLVELGLIYGASILDGRVTVQMTFTATACPCMEFIREDVTDRLEQESWVSAVAIEEVWDPPWTAARITESGRKKLRSLGVGT